MPKLFSYRTEARAQRTLKALREAWPMVSFSLVVARGFNFLILAETPKGRSGLVQRCKIADFGKLYDVGETA